MTWERAQTSKENRHLPKKEEVIKSSENAKHPLWFLQFGMWANEKRPSFDYIICQHIEFNSPLKPAWMLKAHASRCAKETVPQTGQVWLESALSNFSLLDFCQTTCCSFSPILFNTYLSKTKSLHVLSSRLTPGGKGIRETKIQRGKCVQYEPLARRNSYSTVKGRF